MTLQSKALCAALLLVTSPAWAIYQNGGFEQNSFANWTIGGGLNPGLAGAEPFNGASVVINGTTAGPTSLVGVGATDVRAPMLVLPRVGQYTAKVNDESTGAVVTTIAQSDVITAADRDPADARLHVRFSFAPVLNDPAHSPQQQPYFYVRVRNTTDNVTLFEQFAYSGQAGAQFQNGAGNWKYMPFQNVDAVIPDTGLGKNIETYLVAADCSLGGHGGYVYLDGFGSTNVPAPGGGGQNAVAAPALSTFSSLMLAGMFLGFGLVRVWRSGE
jgi:hypothetical protein